MRVHLIKFIYSVIIMSGLWITNLSAQTGNPDTTKLLAAVSKKTIEYKTSIAEANVIFPENLEAHKEQSLDYVEKYSTKQRDFLLHTYQTGKKYFPKIVAVLKRYQLPEELKVLIALESGFSANAVSKVGAVGYWQIMDVVAKEYGLQIAPRNTVAGAKIKDDRKNLIKSTSAAAKYLRDRQTYLNNNLLLMVASYNCGLGTIRHAIKKSGKTNPEFWDIKKFLPAETKNFVLNFIALNVIFNNYENFANRQLLFAPKVIKIPFESPVYNNSIPVETLDAD